MKKYLLWLVGAALACGASVDDIESDETAEYGQTEQAISTLGVYGVGVTSRSVDSNGNGSLDDTQCWGDQPFCDVPLDRTVRFKVDIGVPPFELSQAISRAFAYMQGDAGSNWVIATGGTSNSERIFLDTSTTGKCATALAAFEPSGFSSKHNQAGWVYVTHSSGNIRICITNYNAAVANAGSEEKRISKGRNILAHEIGHAVGLGHNPASFLMRDNASSTVDLAMTTTEKAELQNYDPNG